jgi:RHS repeat-associated protein
MRKRNIGGWAILILAVCVFAAFGQNTDNKNGADRALHGSGRVNASTLGMEIDIPLGSYPGRGIDVPINLSYSSKLWRLQSMGNNPIPGGNYSSCKAHYAPFFAEESASGWTSSLAVPYIEYTGANNLYNYDGSPISFEDVTCPTSGGGGGSYPYYYIRRLVVHLPSGETHELRADDTAIGFPVGESPNLLNWNTTFYAVDSSNLKYIQDSTTNTYRVQMPDGSYYDFDGSSNSFGNRKATKFSDRNGNYTTYHNDNTTTYPYGYWTDTLGRNIAIPLALQAPASPTTASSPQVYAMPGVTGTYKLQWKQLNGGTQAESALTDINGSSYQLKYIGDTYGCTNGSGFPTYCTRAAGSSLFTLGEDARMFGTTLFNPIVLTEIELPTGQKYKFTYDVYGRIEKIIYPTGGEEKFQYSVVPTLSMVEYDDKTALANFGVTDRKVYPTSGQSANYHWTYSAAHVGSTGYQVTINNPDNTRSERLLYQGNGTNVNSQFGYDNGFAGTTYEERGYNSANSLVSKKLTTWTKSTFGIADWHPRVSQEESIIYEGGSGISTTSKFYYSDGLNYRDKPVLQNKVEHYAFVTAGSSLPSNPVRTTETTYSTDSAYLSQNIIGLATASVVRDGGGAIVSRSEMVYDDSGYSPNVGRGNPTTARVWDSTKGNYDNTNAYISTRARFDTYGNQYESIDAKGNSMTTIFDSTYHTFPVQVTSAVPDPTNTYGSNAAFVTYATFNTTTGLPLTATDANGLETRIDYDPATLRPLNTKTFYQGTQVGSTSEIVYHDGTNNYWTKSRAQVDANNWAESITYFDGLGRAYKSEQVDSQGNVFVEKEFDAQGRVSRVTNPYRSGETKQWTTNTYDEASRIKEVTMPDGAKVTTDYGVSTSGIIGATKQITDQAGKKRKGISDALGRMVRVIEDPTAQTPLETNYVFDTLGNLRKTTQGEQHRYFTYDSLGRLLYAKQPEQNANSALSYTDSITSNTAWSVKYVYDDNGNITSTTDAKNITITGTYDNFNRLKTRTYSDNITPNVAFYYDGKGLTSVPNFSKGKTTKVSSSVSETRYTSFDNLGKLLTSEQRTPFGTETAENATPRVSTYQYDAYGKLLSETYPSGRTVKMDYNADGDVSSVWGTAGANNRIYANGFSYNSSGAIERLRLGNGKWETASYNNRLQVTEIGLGYSATDKSLLKLEYGYGSSTENNGNLRTQKISFSGLAQPFEQTYIYDSLNRLQSAEEKVNNSTTWKQTFSLDRYGNRRFDTAGSNTTTLGSCSQAICNPLINTSDNRFSANQGYSYDANGNVTQDAEGKRFGYDAENHQKEFFATGNNGSNADAIYLYDGEGKRVKKISSTETVIFVYNAGGQLVAEYSTQLASPQQVSYLTADHLGSPRVITDQNGAVTTRKDYAAFGDESSTAQRTSGLKYDSSETRKSYTGYEKDGESGLDFAEARYYNSTHGRFTSVDPMTASADTKNPQTFNRYSYVLNSPYKFTDPLGLISSSTGANGGFINSGGFQGGCTAQYSSCNFGDEGGDFLPEAAPPDTGVAGGDESGSLARGAPADEQTASDPQLPPTPGTNYYSPGTDYYVKRDGTILLRENINGNNSRFLVENGEGQYVQVANLTVNEAGLVLFPDSGDGFNRYGTVDGGGVSGGETVGQGDHYLKPIVAAALFGLISVLKDSGITLSLGDMSSSNGSDPWQKGFDHHVGHGHKGNRSGQDIDFHYVNSNGVGFQSPTATTDSQFSTEKNQFIFDTAKKFGFINNYQGNSGTLNGVGKADKHEDHGHLGYR